MSTTGHENELVTVAGLKATAKKGGNKGIFNEAICSTAGATAAKVTNTVPASFTLASGATIIVKFTYGITVANATLQVGDTAAKPIYYRGAALEANKIKAGDKVMLRYDGVSYNIVGSLGETYPVMGASGANHASGLVPDTPAEAGTAKFLREDGSWQVPAYPTIEDFHEAVATLQSAPTSSTLTYQRDGQTYNYKVGDEVRVYDSENGSDETHSYVFYKLYDLVTSGNTTTAFWALAGAGGGGGSVMGKIRVNLRAYVNDVLSQGTDLNGADVTLTNTTNSEVVGTQTWVGTTLIFTGVTPMKAYSISVTAKTGYTQPAAQTIAELPFSADETLNFDYEADEYTASIQSNQGTDSGISSAQITIAGTAVSDGGKVKVAKGTTITPTATDITGYRKTVSTSGKTVTVLYETEILSLTVSADDSSDVSAQQVTVTDTSSSTVLGTLVSGQTLKIAYGTEYKLSAAALGGYTTPTDVTATAGQTSRSVAMEYVYNPIEMGYIILDQTSSDPTKKVIDENGKTYSNGYTRPSVIDSIRAASHCYVGTFANNKMTLKQLDDTDGTKYADGTSAATDIATVGKDVWMRLPEFYTKVSTVATDKIKIEFAFGGNPGTGWKKWGGNDLIGKYEAYEESSKTYSVSGKASTGSVSQANFKTHARARGTGFSIVKWRHQNIMAILFYAYYGHTNCQSLCGSGANSYTKNTGLKNSLGMTDTTSSNGNTDNIVFWGLENWWGNKYEWVDNVVVDHPNWKITEDDGTVRTVATTGSATDAWIYATKFVLGDDLDVIPAPGTSGGSDSQGYCDGQYLSTSASRVVARSCGSADALGGVAFANAYDGSSNTHAYRGSRLAFTGTIEIS